MIRPWFFLKEDFIRKDVVFTMVKKHLSNGQLSRKVAYTRGLSKINANILGI